jgi:hypothetical protein
MAGLFSDHHNDPHGGFGVLYFMADDFREMGHSFLDLWCCHFVLWSISNQNDLGLFSAKRQVDGI